MWRCSPLAQHAFPGASKRTITEGVLLKTGEMCCNTLTVIWRRALALTVQRTLFSTASNELKRNYDIIDRPNPGRPWWSAYKIIIVQKITTFQESNENPISDDALNTYNISWPTISQCICAGANRKLRHAIILCSTTAAAINYSNFQ